MSIKIFIGIVKEFFYIEKDIFINEPNKKIKLLSIKDKKEERGIVISRKSIKHFTESRRKELYKFAEGKQLEIILSLSADLKIVLTEPDLIYKNEKKENSFVYIKKIDEYKTPRAAVLEIIKNEYHIVSIHMVKEKDYEKIINKNKNH